MNGPLLYVAVAVDKKGGDTEFDSRTFVLTYDRGANILSSSDKTGGR